jgi:hypothetical protein
MIEAVIIRTLLTVFLWIIAYSCYAFILDKGTDLEIFDKNRLRWGAKFGVFLLALPVGLVIILYGLTTKLLTFCSKE